MSIGTQRKAAAITVLAVLLVIGIAAAAYVLGGLGQNKSTPVALADAPATQKDSDAVVSAARDKLSAIRKKIEGGGHAHNAKDHAAIVDAGFEYMATHLHDPDVAKFDPQSGFTDFTVSPADGGQMVLLLERTTDPSDGLNLTIDPKSGTVSETKYWGKQN
jgi:hypothetical protein